MASDRHEDFELRRRIDACRKDFENVTGAAFEHFFCPIMLRDEFVPIIRGHVVNEALRSSNQWLPQRRDVDGFYGSVVESDMISVVSDLGKDPVQIWLTPELHKRHRPKVILGGTIVGHYFSATKPVQVPGHTNVVVTDAQDNVISNVTLKASSDELLQITDGRVEIVVERDYRPAVIAAVLKAAHLTLFKLLGYAHVLSSGGRFVADILQRFYSANGGKHGVAEDDIARYFLPFENMVSPVIVADDTLLRGTIDDSLLLSCLTSHDDVFSIGIIVKMGRDRFCVFVPTDRAIDTYFSFLAEPPTSIRAKVTRFRAPADGDQGAWEASPDDLRLSLGRAMTQNSAVK